VRAAAALASVAVVLAVAGCGGGSEGAPARAWASDVCTAVGTWVEDFQARFEGLQQSVTPGMQSEEARTLLAEFYGDLAARTDELLGDLDAAGRPAVDEGAAISRDFRAPFESIRPALLDAQADAGQLPVDDEAAFQQAAAELDQSLEQAFDDAGEAFDRLDERQTSELDEAFDEEAACQKYRDEFGG
jgi:hypothetical protein